VQKCNSLCEAVDVYLCVSGLLLSIASELSYLLGVITCCPVCFDEIFASCRLRYISGD